MYGSRGLSQSRFSTLLSLREESIEHVNASGNEDRGRDHAVRKSVGMGPYATSNRIPRRWLRNNEAVLATRASFNATLPGLERPVFAPDARLANSRIESSTADTFPAGSATSWCNSIAQPQLVRRRNDQASVYLLRGALRGGACCSSTKESEKGGSGTADLAKDRSLGLAKPISGQSARYNCCAPT